MSNLQNIFVEFTITNNCNCNCRYCFEGIHNIEKRNLDEENRQLALIDDLCQNFDRTTYGNLTLSFWGGEPFLNIDFMYQIINQTWHYPFVRYHIFSNGTLIDKYKDFLSQKFIDNIKNKLHIQLSYDGEPHHTIKRGNNSEKIFEVARMLRENQIHFDFKATLSFDMLKELPQIWKSYEKLYGEFGDCARYYPTLDTIGKDLDYYEDWKESLQTILRYEYQFVKKNKKPLWAQFERGSKSNCLLGNSIHIHNDGTIYICHGCAYKENNENLKLGKTSNIKSLYDVISNRFNVPQIPKQCQQCPSTYCSVCHISQLNENEDPLKNWISCRPRNQNRCKYFQYFGYVSKVLKFICMG